MSKNLSYKDLNSYQILVEITKRFARLEYQKDNDDLLDMIDVFGEEWRLLNKEAKEQAAEWFREYISNQTVKGMIYSQQPDGTYLYKRIPNDMYRR